MTYRPQSYAELVQDASKAVLSAIGDGVKLMEVEFPAVPVNIDGKVVHSMRCIIGYRSRIVDHLHHLYRVAAYKGSSDLFIDSNIQYALSAAKQVSNKP